MKRTVIITVMSENNKLSCSETVAWETESSAVEAATQFEIEARSAHHRLTLLESRAPWKKAPTPKRK